MSDNPTTSRPIDAARRGYIIQRVLVDGWTPARAATAFEVEERDVARWVARYRRHGMASLSRTEIDAERLPWPWLGWLRGRALRIVAQLRREFGEREAASGIVLHRNRDDERGRG